jgi:hypothetical protein
MSDELNPKLPEETGARTRISKWVAYVLDDLIKIPGTNRRIGLDPILGLIPGAGDILSSAGGLTLLAAGAKRKVPMSVYLRMAANWALNAIVGAIPFVGDMFSFWFKSNKRNYALMRAHLDDQTGEEAEKAGWGTVFILLVAAGVVFTVLGFLLVWVIGRVFG